MSVFVKKLVFIGITKNNITIINEIPLFLFIITIPQIKLKNNYRIILYNNIAKISKK